jgi:O-antigen/teichoic acid export membrane protein
MGHENLKTTWSRFRSSDLRRHFSTLLTGAAIAQAIPLLASPVLTRLYSPSEMGLWSLYTSLLLTFVSFSALRLDVAIVSATDDATARSLYAAATKSNVASALIISIVAIPLGGLLASKIGAPDLEPWLMLLGINLLALGQYQILVHWMNRYKHYSLMSRSRVLQSGGVNGIQLGMGLLGFGVHGLILGTLAGHALAYVEARRQPALQGIRKRTVAPTPKYWRTVRAHWRMPVLNGLTTIADSVRSNGINILVATTFSQHALGIFSLAWRTVLMPISLVSGTLSQVFYQRFSVTPRGSMVKVALQSSVICAAAGAPLFGALALVSEPLFAFVFGEQWRAAGTLARAMTPYLYLTFITSPLSTLFIVVQRQAMMLWFSIAYMVVPLTIIAVSKGTLEQTVWRLSLAMSCMLCLLLVLVATACRAYDRERPSDPIGARIIK